MGARSSSNKRVGGWMEEVLYWFNYLSGQAPTPDTNLASYRQARRWRKLYGAKKQTDHSLIAKLLQHLLLIVREFRTQANSEATDSMCETLLPDVVAPEAHQNDAAMYVSSADLLLIR